jgi:ATP-dependent RNA helicase DeaD
VNTTWFSLNVGRHGNADPKWVLPLICRLGSVTKADIGAIRIFDTETKFELAWEAVGSFLASVEASGETEIVFERTTPANQAPPRSGKYGPQRPPNAITPRAFAKPGSRPYSKPFNAAKPKRAKG